MSDIEVKKDKLASLTKTKEFIERLQQTVENYTDHDSNVSWSDIQDTLEGQLEGLAEDIAEVESEIKDLESDEEGSNEE